MREPLEAVLAANPRPAAAVTFFGQMMRDLSGADVMQQVGGGWVGGRVGGCVGKCSW